MQRIYVALRHNRLFQDVEYHYGTILEKLNLQILRIRRRHFNGFFLINIFTGTKCCSSDL
jgi:hypothetical protein